MSLWGTNDRDDGLWCCASEDVGVYKNTGEVNGLVFLCTGTEVTALATTLSSATLLSQCSMTSTPTSTSTTASTSANASGEEDSPAGVPAGAIAGGVVGGVAGIALVVVGIYFLKKKKNVDPEEQPSTEVPVQEGQQWSQQRRTNFHGRRPSELETVEPRLEMNGVKPTYELDATEEQKRERDVSPLSPPR
ncbi:hypothetical protein CCHR01_08987 [Colletotrichum chrysophilum]|uniref:Uncharacterized protein n=1 Tax=Colletotrichum chrysophilum TaxID=1836956 RepID=A0AAD9EEK0_9PEZI|nr:hypothetical protein CCHR01_08987 [Colletotrichum chrysophilum]